MSSPVCDITRLSTKGTPAAWSLYGRLPEPKQRDQPGPASYSAKDRFASKYRSQPSVSFGAKLYPPSSTLSTGPSPAAYNPRNPNMKVTHVATLKGKLPDLSLVNKAPGPGAYDPVLPSSRGKIPILARLKDPRSLSDTPGPGTYSARLPSNRFATFGIGERDFPLTSRCVPSPGSYNLPSTINTGHGFTFSGKLKTKQPEASSGIGVIATSFGRFNSRATRRS